MILNKVIRRLKKLYVYSRLRPIRVFCLHQISTIYDPIRCYDIDWVSTNDFQSVINSLSLNYTFISLTEAKQKLERDWIRRKRYAVLTFDDGYASIYPSLEWLEQRGIPFTLFINAKYLDGYSCSPHILEHARKHVESISDSEVVKGLYLSEVDLSERATHLCQIGSHGYEHLDATMLSPSDFAVQISVNQTILGRFSNFVPFHAYTWGNHTKETDRILHEMRITPVMMDGQKNYNDSTIIHRELFPLEENKA